MRASLKKTALMLITFACAVAPARPETPPVRSEGDILVDADGRSLYTFDRDPENEGKSVCYGLCANSWPPLKASGGDEGVGDFSIIKRTDGTMQWAYKGKPLYYWAKDRKPGDTKGDGIYDVWHLARHAH